MDSTDGSHVSTDGSHVHHLWMDFDQEKSFFKSSSDDDNNRFLVTFKFCCHPSLFNLLFRQDSAPLYERINLSLIETYVLVSLAEEEKSRDILDRELQDWPVQPDGRRWLIDRAMEKAREMINSMPSHHNSVHLHFEVEAICLRVYYDMTEERVRMVPAEESSIESLTKKKIMDCGMDCSICLEEISIEEEGLFMPCNHVFHEDCIKKWLRTSNNCPICRYQMPKRQEL